MAKIKTPQMASELKVIRIADRPEIATDVANLDRLRPELEESIKAFEKVKLIRQGEEVRRYLERNALLWDQGVTDQDLAGPVNQIAISGMTERVAQSIKLFTNKLPMPFRDDYDIEAVLKFRDAQRRVDLLKRAVAMQERKVSEKKKALLASARDSSLLEREQIARKVANFALELIGTIREERAFFERLRYMDEALPAMQNLPPFPITADPDSEVCRWIAAALQLPEIEARGLMVQPFETGEGEASSVAGGQ